jgi:signal peptidase II
MSAVKARALVDSLVFLFLLCLDQVSKLLALAYLIPGKPLVLGTALGVHFELLLTTNVGAAWGALSQFPWALFVIRLLFIALLLYFYLHQTLSFAYRLAVMAILAGAIGNIIDTIFFGHVIDMIHVILWGWDYPVFNLADSWIFLGCIIFLLASWKSTGKKMGG